MEIPNSKKKNRNPSSNRPNKQTYRFLFKENSVHKIILPTTFYISLHLFCDFYDSYMAGFCNKQKYVRRTFYAYF